MALTEKQKEYIKCLDCSETNYDGFMVFDSVWREAVSERRGRLHLYCLEKRLGRLLRIKDFREDLPINKMLILGSEIGARENT